MNDFLTQRIPETVISGDIAPDLLVNLGPQGDQFKLNLAEGTAARLYDFSVYQQIPGDGRYGVNLVRSPVPVDGDRAWTNDDEVLSDGNVIAALQLINITGTGDVSDRFPHTELLWPLDYRVVINPRVTGFCQVARQIGFRLRYQVIKASKVEIAAILFWQNQGVKVA